MPKLSVIIPVYNVERYLKKCVDSVCQQTFGDLEIILIDDGSPDRCGILCDELAQADNRIKVIHQQNQGVSAARNKGLALAKGDWIAFVDSDDYLKPDAYEALIHEAEDNTCDAAFMGFEFVNGDGNVVRNNGLKGLTPTILNHEEAISKQFDIPQSIRLGMVNKIFRRTIIDGLSYDENLKASEDTLLLHQCLKRTKKVFWCPKPLYMNVQRAGSAMHGGLKVYDMEKSLDVHKAILEDVRIHYPQLYPKALYHYLDTCIWKLRGQLPVPSSLSHSERRRYCASIDGMKKHIRNEYGNILRCSEFSLKRKLVYLWIGIRG